MAIHITMAFEIVHAQNPWLRVDRLNVTHAQTQMAVLFHHRTTPISHELLIGQFPSQVAEA